MYMYNVHKPVHVHYLPMIDDLIIKPSSCLAVYSTVYPEINYWWELYWADCLKMKQIVTGGFNIGMLTIARYNST